MHKCPRNGEHITTERCIQRHLLNSIENNQFNECLIRKENLAFIDNSCNHYYTALVVLAWSYFAGRWPAQLVTDLFVQHQGFFIRCTYTLDKHMNIFSYLTVCFHFFRIMSLGGGLAISCL